jgi:predicted nuclease of predicted toxin-antitoxin system
MRFLIDANLPRSIIALVTSLGHESEFARDIGLAAAPDSEIAARAKTTGAALLTRDLDFSDIRRYPPAIYSGIVVLRLPDGVIADDTVAVTTKLSGQSWPAHLPVTDLQRVESSRRLGRCLQGPQR